MSLPRPLHQALRALIFTAALVAGVVSGAAPGVPSEARADDEAPIKAGAVLLARSDVELDKITIARGWRVEVTTVSSHGADILLPDGYVLKHVPVNRLRYFFEVVR